MNFFVYILTCSDDSYYIGSTANLEQRVRDHHNGKASQWTEERRPITLSYYETFPDRTSATRREKQLKGWSRIKKEKLINYPYLNHNAHSPTPTT